jgi:hypothetical protein
MELKNPTPVGKSAPQPALAVPMPWFFRFAGEPMNVL